MPPFKEPKEPYADMYNDYLMDLCNLLVRCDANCKLVKDFSRETKVAMKMCTSLLNEQFAEIHGLEAKLKRLTDEQFAEIKDLKAKLASAGK